MPLFSLKEHTHTQKKKRASPFLVANASFPPRLTNSLFPIAISSAENIVQRQKKRLYPTRVHWIDLSAASKAGAPAVSAGRRHPPLERVTTEAVWRIGTAGRAVEPG